jgi:hypothetical protein
MAYGSALRRAQGGRVLLRLLLSNGFSSGSSSALEQQARLEVVARQQQAMQEGLQRPAEIKLSPEDPRLRRQDALGVVAGRGEGPEASLTGDDGAHGTVSFLRAAGTLVF